MLKNIKIVLVRPAVREYRIGGAGDEISAPASFALSVARTRSG
jgi:hypothetical protein